ncbi:MAG TPA: hypothetical protein VFQ53_37640 [Kofleriaceae bacterium]|nr:hypothetical protein [Kofleriaceae bacterium]
MIELAELYRIARTAERVLAPVANAPPELWVAALRPRDADYDAVFVGEAAARARAGYASLWANPPKSLGKRGQTTVHAFASEADALGHDNEFSREFPGGYRKIASQLSPHKVWLTFKLVEPGASSGMSYDGLVWLADDHWAWFPKPWRVLADDTSAN